MSKGLQDNKKTTILLFFQLPIISLDHSIEESDQDFSKISLEYRTLR